MSASPYIVSRRGDAIGIIACPLLALAAMHALWAWSGRSDALIYGILTAFVVIGHHMPGWLRAFGEPSVYARYRARLWASFAAVPVLMLLPTVLGWGAHVVVVVTLFDIWHVAMQQHGFGRIYSAKDADLGAGGARLDLACVLTWYAAVVAWSDSWMFPIAAVFRQAGLGQLSELEPASWRLLKLGLLVASAGLLIAYVARAASRRRTGPVTLRKHVLHGIAFAVLAVSYQDPSWYRAQSVQNLFHAMQYFFLVWAFSHRAMARAPERSPLFYRSMFRRAWTGLPLYIAAIGLYAVAALFVMTQTARGTEQTEQNLAVQVMGSIAFASLLLHFYVDSFIWKVRSKQVRQALDLGTGGEVAAPASNRAISAARALGHAVGYYGIPIALVALIGSRAPHEDSLEVMRREAELFPRSAQARYLYGVAAQNQQSNGIARRELEAALALSPSQDGPAWQLAELDRSEHRRDDMLAHLLAAVRAAPEQPYIRMRYGCALAEAGRSQEAETELKAVIHQIPTEPDGYLNLARLYRMGGRNEDAIDPLRQAILLTPDSGAPVRELVKALEALGRHREAILEVKAFAGRNPDQGSPFRPQQRRAVPAAGQ